MLGSRSILKTGGLMLACAALAIAVSAAAVRAQEDEDNLPDAVLFRQILKGLGLKHDDPGIEYRERSPLVVPQTMTLPPPETKTAADRTPNWPDDYDARAARKYKAARAKERHRSIEEESRPLMPNELEEEGRRASSREASVTRTPEQDAKPLMPSALGYVGGIFDSFFGKEKPESKPFTGEPPRTALVEPPPGYQTPSPKAPYASGGSNIKGTTYDPLTMTNK